MSRIRFSLMLPIACAVLAMLPSAAHASFQLRITSYDEKNRLTAEMVVSDQGSTGQYVDRDKRVGSLTFSGVVGNFSISVEAAGSKPLYLSGGAAHMALGSVSAFSKGPGSLLIELTDTDWGATTHGTLSGKVDGTVGGSADSQIVFGAYMSRQNGSFNTTNLAAAIQVNVDGEAFTGVGSADKPAIVSPYSMTLTALLKHSDGGGTSNFGFEALSTANPEPATILSAAFGLPVIGGYLWRRRKVAKIAAA